MLFLIKKNNPTEHKVQEYQDISFFVSTLFDIYFKHRLTKKIRKKETETKLKKKAYFRIDITVRVVGAILNNIVDRVKTSHVLQLTRRNHS